MNESKPWLDRILCGGGGGGLVALLQLGHAEPYVQLTVIVILGAMGIGTLWLAFFKVKCERERARDAARLQRDLAIKTLPEHAGHVLAAIGQTRPADRSVEDRHPRLL